ncbi:MAG: hypothetical protein LBS41_06225 [Streptococcaceae bacterium]|jgi:hypothetical protein|nr:hypothetical protein [Streptococcaceae bacterium]
MFIFCDVIKSFLLSQGVDIEVIIKQLGHQSSTQIRETLNTDDDEIKNILSRFGKKIKQKALHQGVKPF